MPSRACCRSTGAVGGRSLHPSAHYSHRFSYSTGRRAEASISSSLGFRADRSLSRRRAASPAAMLTRLKGIGPQTAAVLWSEGLFRQFDNRRQVAAYAGLAPTPWQSGSIDHEQGVSKAGKSRLRTTMVRLARLWLQNQPAS